MISTWVVGIVSCVVIAAVMIGIYAAIELT